VASARLNESQGIERTSNYWVNPRETIAELNEKYQEA